jgi:hypothetical protein
VHPSGEDGAHQHGVAPPDTPIPVRPDVIDARYVSFVDAAGLRVLLAS